MFNSYPIINVSTSQKKNIELYKNAIRDNIYKLEEVNCNLCGSEESKILFRNDRYGIDQCTVVCMKCGLIYSSPRLIAESVEKFYRSDEYRNIYEGESIEEIFLNKYKNAVNYKYIPLDLQKYYKFMFIDFLNESGIVFESVCEIGAAGGTNLIPFKRMGKEVTGIDYSRKLVKLGREKGIKMIQGSIGEIDKTYDLALLIHVVEHFLDPIMQIKKLSKYVNRYLFIEIPGIMNQLPPLQNAHFYYFSINTLFKCVSKAGFKLVEYRTVNSNDYVFALFEKDNCSIYQYDYAYELKRSLFIVNKFKLKNIIKSILKKFPLGERILIIIKTFKNRKGRAA